MYGFRIATYAAKLFLEGRAKFILFSGGMGSGPHSGANLHGKVARYHRLL